MWNWLGFRKPEAAAVASAARFNPKRVRRVLLDCANEIGGEASARTRVAELAAMYRPLADDGKRAFLELLAASGDADDVEAALLDDYAKSDGAARRLAALRLRAALAATPLRVLRQFNLLPDGVKFLVDVRADALRLGARDGPALAIVDEALLALFRDWFV